ncbi:MAG: DUF1549 and DUF1553 domain-containing protein [Pirellulales bacterium]|nr:DUF1549 and DUF1553 domain-containing protein [Pirellulales bacterium]
MVSIQRWLLLACLAGGIAVSVRGDEAPPTSARPTEGTVATEPSAEEVSLAILPAEAGLVGPEARQRLIVERRQNDRYVGQMTEGFSLVSADPQIAQVEGGILVPRDNGETTVTASDGVRQSSIRVTVRGLDQPFAWSFRNHVESVLTRAGCNSGACHGAASGKRGFKLSLRGYDPLRDYTTLTRQSLGRRTVPNDPGRSLILTKPTGAIPHGGGLRFDVNSLEYRVLAEWIAAGAPAPRDDDPKMSRLEILPSQIILAPSDAQQLLALAHFSDGHTEDVTRWTKFTASNATVGDIDDTGLVRVTGHGEGAFTAWYLSQVATATVTSPYDTPVTSEAFTTAPRNNLIDEMILDKLKDLNLAPSPQAGDAEFLRRAYLDTIGLLPPADEARAFLADSSPDKRSRVIDGLLTRPEFVDYWAYKWSDLLLVNSEKLPPPAMWSYYNWIRNHVAANTPWDKIARELVTATGSTLENGAANFYVLHQDPLELAETTSIALLGMSINCARCHNHPLEKWTNDQYYAMANLFARVRLKNGGETANQVLFVGASGDLVQPLTGRPQSPAPLDAPALALEDPTDRRLALADWLTSPENPYFARAIVNRVWANFFGVGLVEAVDDLRLSNPASNPQLHQALARWLAEQSFDLKALMRLILESSTYQRASSPLPENAEDKRFYARYYPRRLMAEVLSDAIAQVAGTTNEYPGYPAGWRALQLPDSNIANYFLQKFGRPDRVITCECERTSEPSMVQVLHLTNGDAINSRLAAKGNHLEQVLSTDAPPQAIVEDLYLRALSRMPSAEESTRLAAEIRLAADDLERRMVVEDLYWSVLSSKEFLFNH